MQYQDSEVKKSKRYVLCKKDGDAIRPCAFFGTANGCRSGSACPFSHDQTSSAGSKEANTTDKKKRKEIDLSSNDEVVEKKHRKDKSEKHKTPKHSKDIDDVTKTFSEPKDVESLKFAPFSPPGFSRVKGDNGEDREDSLFLFSVVNTALQQGQITSPFADSANTVPATSQQFPFKRQEACDNSVTSDNFFLPKDHVQRVLESAGTPHATLGKVSSKSRKSKSPSSTRPNIASSSYPNSSTTKPVSADLASAVPIAPALFQAPISAQQVEIRPFPVPPPITQNESWASLVAYTMKAPRFQSEYKFDLSLEWVQARPFGSW